MNSTTTLHIHKYKQQQHFYTTDMLIEELPLQIVVEHGSKDNRVQEELSVTMRTPGNDEDLVRGFLFCEGFINNAADIAAMEIAPADNNKITIKLQPSITFTTGGKKRNFVAAASCGFCGKTNAAEMLEQSYAPLSTAFTIPAAMLYKLPSLFSTSQNLFSQTGGSHAVVLTDSTLSLLHLSEDVGRHNATDKLIGKMLAAHQLPLQHNIILFSGRLGYELVQKALKAGVPMVCSIGAPTSLAIEIAARNGMTVVGFLKENTFNIYCGEERILQS